MSGLTARLGEFIAETRCEHMPGDVLSLVEDAFTDLRDELTACTSRPHRPAPVKALFDQRQALDSLRSVRELPASESLFTTGD